MSYYFLGIRFFSAASGTAQPNDFHGPHAMIWQRVQGLGKPAM